MSDLDTISLDDLYNHLKVYESEVQKKSKPNSQNMAFISSAKHISENEDGNTACVPTASTNVPTASASDINQIDEDDMEEMDIKWNMALLSMRADKFWKKTGKKISIQGSNVAGFDKSKVECFNCHKMGYFARECRALRNQDRERKDNYKQGSKAEEQATKALMAIDGTLKEEKEGVDGKLAGLLKASKDLDNLIKSQRLDKIKDGLGYSVVPSSPAQLYLSPKKDLSWTGLPECADDTVTDYSRPSATIESKTESPKKPPVKYAEQYIKPNKKPNVRGNQRNWNNLKSHQLGPDFVMKKKACFNCALRSPHRALWVPTVNKNFPPVNRKFSHCSRNFPIANRKFPTVSRKFPTGSTKCSTADMGMKGKADSGCSRHMTGIISYLSDFEPFDGGYVSFVQGGCKITGKGTIKTGKLEFENVYFVKDLKYNLFSVSQICDNKNSVLFTDSECIVLGRDFKLLDDANIFLRTPR
nr:ribonuclease H-like domain-containing protein [Tanacetum cinerariifolium]